MPGVRVAPDLLERDFRPTGPNQTWSADITYIPTWEGFLYLAHVQHLHSRRIVGWSMADHLRSEFVVDALEMALARRRGEVKRRTKVMGRFPGEDSCLSPVWAVLDLLITHQTNGIHFNALDRQRLKRIRYEGDEQTIPEEVTAA